MGVPHLYRFLTCSQLRLAHPALEHSLLRISKAPDEHAGRCLRLSVRWDSNHCVKVV